MKEIPLTRGYVTIVDDEDYEMLSQFTWCAWSSKGNTVYARSRAGEVGPDGARKIVYLHNLLMPHKAGVSVDHKDRNGLNNRKSNLRYADCTQQNLNKAKQRNARHKYKGVALVSPTKPRKWQARAQINRKMHSLGYYHTEEEAARAYDAFVSKHCGEHAVLNFPL